MDQVGLLSPFTRIRLRSGSSSSRQAQKSRGSLLVPGSTAASARKTVDASEPAFKPRKVKKAAERRVGEGNDYAQVEAVLEDFEKRLGNNNATDEQRKYWAATGLDVALLEQNKAKASLSTVDDDSLEQAFREAASEPTVPKKRTREDIVRELKEKRGITTSTPVNDGALEAAKKQGKFKPIGFKPIGTPEAKPKKKKVKADGTDGERKKKKRRGVSIQSSSSTSLPPEDDMADDDFDIFAGAGEYEGIDLGDEEDEEDGEVAGKPDNPELEDGEESAPPPRKWFEEDEPDPQPSTSKLPLPTVSDKPSSRPVDEDEEGELEQPTRLVPLASSALPSIKDLLAMDKAANSSEKRRKKKDKKKSGKDDDDDEEAPSKTKMSAEVKAERDYKRLKSYTDKKAGRSNADVE
ncbi:hypothetical protein B0H13DRAFT_2231392 [Mycena leptocephala]|nr:hypothetical protein B0H13DRAFT_2231392 [Mycena leptocephala]